MKFKNLRIGTQLVIGLTALLLFVVTIGGISYLQTNRIHNQTELLYNHPMQVRRALGELRSSVYMIHWAIEKAFDYPSYQDMAPFLQTIQTQEEAAFQNFEVLYNQYLGPKSDVDSLYNAFLRCRKNRIDVLALLQAGAYDQAWKLNIHKGSAIHSDHLLEIIGKLDLISNFAEQKADMLIAESHELNNRLNLQLLVFVLIILAISVLINNLLMKNIHGPLKILTHAANRFKEGELHARGNYVSNNEFGELSAAFDRMADEVQESLELSQKSSMLDKLMMSENDAHQFFHKTITKLAELTHSQMAAVYLLGNDKQSFHHFSSIGLDDNARGTFSALDMEGEMGHAMATQQIQHILLDPDHTRFIFSAVSGNLVPKELLTIPIIVTDQVIAMISLASLNAYGPQDLDLIHKVHNTLNARIAGILSFKRMMAFSQQLEQKNRELELQRSELAAQSSELTEQNTELETQKNQLSEANRLKTSFLSNMSHELRTPLNSVIALSGVLNRRLAKQISDEDYSYLSVIERNGKQLLSLINDILDISRIEAGREEIEISEFNVCTQVNEVVAMLQPQALDKNLELMPAKGECEIVLASDVSKFRHIIQNLLSNAVKFTEKGRIEVVVALKEGKAMVSVHDTGIGIASQHLPHIFDEFRQADSSTSRRYGGSGLGLAIASKYANLLGGHLRVESMLGAGSIFFLELPLILDHKLSGFTTQPAALTSEAGFKGGKRKRKDLSGKSILLVEDSEPAIIQMKDLLEPEGLVIHVASNGNEALQYTSKRVPDAIILDLMMPEMDGFAVLKQLREDEKTRLLPVLILTAKHISHEELSFLKCNNIFQLIQKGDINQEALLQLVEGMLFQDSTPKAAEAETSYSQISGKPLVLVVEDNPDNMLTINAMLSDAFVVIGAENGQEGVDLAIQRKPELILMDIALPEMDGVEAFKRIRNHPVTSHIPIIALTASAMISDREVLLAAGFDGYIPKPIDEVVFYKTIKSILYGQ